MDQDIRQSIDAYHQSKTPEPKLTALQIAEMTNEERAARYAGRSNALAVLEWKANFGTPEREAACRKELTGPFHKMTDRQFEEYKEQCRRDAGF